MAQLKDSLITGDLRVTGTIYGDVPLNDLVDADDLKAIEALSGTSGLLKKTAANTWTLDTAAYTTSSGVTSVRVQATSPVVSSVNTAQSSSLNTTISLADNYGDTKNPYASKTARYVLAAPASAAGVPSFRALTNADVGLGNVENTKLSTWAGSSNITTIGTLSSGTVPWARLSNVPTASTSAAGIIQIGTGSGNAAAGNHTHNYAGSSSAGGAASSLSNFKVTTTTNLWAVDSPTTNAIGYQSGLTKADWNYQQTDGALYEQFYNSNWIHEIFGDYRTGQISVRGKNNGTWQAWRRVLDETNAAGILGLGSAAYTASSSYATAGHTHSYLPLAGGTMTGQLKTSFKSSVAMGTYQATATTVPNLCEELRYSSGVAGSVNISTAYTKDSITIATGWYNFLWIPHRSGGVNGAASGDNCNYGSLYLSGMTLSGAYMIRYASEAIAELKNLYKDTTYSAEKGITLSSGKFGHSNAAITAQTTQAVYPIKIDAYGHITGYGSAQTILALGTTATTAAKGNHTHTTSLTSGGTATVNLAANTAYTLTAGGTSVIFKTPADNNTTYPLNGKTINGSYKTAYRTQTKGDTNSGWYVSSIRNDTSSVDSSPQYGSGLAWGNGDTHGYLYTSYSSDAVYIGGGNADKLNWVSRVYTTNYKPTAADVGVSATTSSVTVGSTTFNKYSHPTSDGNKHVPATGTTNNNKFLKAGSTAGSLSWTTIASVSNEILTIVS